MPYVDRRAFLVGAATVGLSTSLAFSASDRLETMAVSHNALWNGIAITPEGRRFVALPNWLGPSAGVGEIDRQGALHPWPGNEWNNWRAGGDAFKSLVNVNAVRLNSKGDELWVVDAGLPAASPRLERGAKLVVFDVSSGTVKRVHSLDRVLADPGASPNDIRFHGQHAFISESGMGSVVLMDLGSGLLRRVLVQHPLLVMDAEKRPVMVDGEPLMWPNGKPFGTSANQLEVSPDGRWLYIQPLNGGLARIDVALLTSAAATPEQLSHGLGFWVDTPPLSGSAIDSDGVLYLNAINDCSIRRLAPNGTMETIIQDDRLRWADAPWLSPDGYLWLPIAQLGWAPMLRKGVSHLQWPTPLFRLKVR
ncbi:MAG: L-dopachrome tautomerase-related protein [Ottowia sp.]|uniref:SMP-30/gluconolactonase/LRE family protein n=1 Tax=Ottowia sp. TaxID=1898956 RepID=UPI0039E43101